jgi:hypothetical protein
VEAGTVSAHVGQIAAVYPGGVAIHLDEVDKIEDAKAAREFLNRIKGVFVDALYRGERRRAGGAENARSVNWAFVPPSPRCHILGPSSAPSSSGYGECASASSRLTMCWHTRRVRDWFIVCIPNFAPDCIAE